MASKCHLELCFHSIVCHDSHPDPETISSIVKKESITTFLIIKVDSGEESSEVKLPQGLHQ
jgi:hypothetical protein